MSLTVTEIQQLEFSQLPLQEQLDIKQKGRPTPEILIFQPGISNNKKYIRSFNLDWYEKKNWLCGCERKHALFCFPCLLMGGESTWTKDGFKNINKMKEKTDKHEHSRKHIENVVSLSLLGSVSAKEKRSETYRLSVIKHNENVKKNRVIISKIIDCIKFGISSEIPLHSHGDKDGSGLFRGLLNFAANLDSDLSHHLSNNEVFKETSTTIRNEILECMLQICRDQIVTEIDDASFVAIMVDDVTDVTEHAQMVIVVRYVLNGEIVERYWGFFTAENQDADGFSKCIISQLNILLKNDPSKLIAQTFDSAGITKGEKYDVLLKIKEIYENVHFVHCYSHSLNLIMKNAANATRNSKIFFSNLSGIPAFFAKYPCRLSVLNKYMNDQISTSTSSSTPVGTGTIRSVSENQENYKRFFEELQSTSTTDEIIRDSTAMLLMLNNDEFLFWLELFQKILPHVDSIYNQMQSRNIDVFQIENHLKNFNDAILKIRNFKYCESSLKTRMMEAEEVCDVICVDIQQRFSFTNHLVATKLFNRVNFHNYNKKLPVDEVAVVVQSYPMIKKEKLMTELQVFYKRKEMHSFNGLLNLLKFLLENNLTDVLGEITKLIKILLTTPMTTSEPERCFSSLERTKTFLRSAMNQERLTALAMIAMEKNMINKIPNFNEKVIDLFSQQKNRGIDFMLK